ncbi:hypothetical protein DID77_00805, partial [Candidatus Marinamargulisbacteria bacterium SCGC AG-439-L15]
NTIPVFWAQFGVSRDEIGKILAKLITLELAELSQKQRVIDEIKALLPKTSSLISYLDLSEEEAQMLMCLTGISL